VKDIDQFVRRLTHSSHGESPAVLGFLHVRNEELRIEQVLDHHRKLGVEAFYVVDNMSTDGTLRILENEIDVNLFTSTLEFKESNCGITVMNHLLDEHGSGSWCLLVDADEHFVYPHCEHKNIRMLTRYLEKNGFDSLFTLMVDMYSRSPVSEARVLPGQTLSDVCHYFDAEPYQKLARPTFPFVDYRGGPRMRLFWEKSDGTHPPTISKVPLVRWKKGLRYAAAAHYMHPPPARLANITGALLHYKFLSDFHERAKIEVARKQHYANAREYRRYLSRLDAEPSLSLYHDGSVRYTKSTDLVKAGLCTNATEWSLFI